MQHAPSTECLNLVDVYHRHNFANDPGDGFPSIKAPSWRWRSPPSWRWWNILTTVQGISSELQPRAAPHSARNIIQTHRRIAYSTDPWQWLLLNYLQNSVAGEDYDPSQKTETSKYPIVPAFAIWELFIIAGNGYAGSRVLQEADAHCPAEAHQSAQDLRSGVLALPVEPLKPNNTSTVRT